MKHIICVLTFCLLTLCGCEEQVITSHELTTPNSQASARQSSQVGPIQSGGQTLPSPTIIEQTYIPANDLFAHTRCRAWRITWPTYPAGTNPSLIPTMFSVTNGTPYSFNFLNNTAAANTYKTSFNLYHNNKLASVYDMWQDLTHVLNAVDKIEITRFNKSMYSAAIIESWVKGRPNMFELYWKDTIDTDSKIENYKQGDIYLFKRVNQNRYGGIRIVSMTPRIIEIYSAEPNS